MSGVCGTLELVSPGLKILECEVPTSSGLDRVYVSADMTGVTAVYTATSPGANVTWMRYNNLGGGYAEPVDVHHDENGRWLLDKVEGNMGYIIEENSERTYIWVVDYASFPLALHSLEAAEEQECGTTALTLQGHADRITYTDINGRQLELSRELTMTYQTLTFDEEAAMFKPIEKEETLEHISSTIHVPAALCATTFTLTGDRFARQWGREQSVTSEQIQPYSIDAHTSAARTDTTEIANMVKSGNAGDLGGSAPAEIEFKAEVTDAAVFTEWQLSGTNDFEDILMRDSNLEFTYTFEELGTLYARFVCDNAAGTCQWTSQVYEITIGESSLLCPNAFSPGASEGVNDEWKVSYKSIVDFECHIFNRWGQKITTLTHPSQGWDGRKGGKLVPAGVYYYVIKARGADGKKYNLSGDINIIDYK